MSQADSSLPLNENDNNRNNNSRKPSQSEDIAVFTASVAVFFGFIRLVYVMKN